jgi:hypothetical protein
MSKCTVKYPGCFLGGWCMPKGRYCDDDKFKEHVINERPLEVAEEKIKYQHIVWKNEGDVNL